MTEVLRYAAFTDTPAGGNPAGIVLDAGGLSDAEMLRIAADVGYSETAFVDGDDIRRSVATRRSPPASRSPSGAAPGRSSSARAAVRSRS